MSSPHSPAHVLIVSFCYEPFAYVSAKRPSRMAHELVKLGFDVTVLTVDWRLDRPPSPRPLEESVAAALATPGVRMVAIDGRLCHPAFDPACTWDTMRPPGAGWPWLRRVKTVIETLGWGCHGQWARLAVEAARQVHRVRPISATWAIYGDNSSHVIAYHLRRKLGIPWVADFKDPWSAAFPPYARLVQKWATGRRLRTAAALTETCAEQAHADAVAFGRPAEVVYSGYDAEAMEAAIPEQLQGGFNVAYLGSIGMLHATSILSGLVQRLQQRGTLERGEVRIHHYGQTKGQIRRLLEGIADAETVIDHGWIDERRAFGVMKGADLLLLFSAPLGPGRVVGVKELEYFASGAPVLHFGKPLDEMVPIIRNCPQIHVVDTVDEAVASFERVLKERQRGSVNPPSLTSFTWAAQARCLGEVLDRAIRSPYGI